MRIDELDTALAELVRHALSVALEAVDGVIRVYDSHYSEEEVLGKADLMAALCDARKEIKKVLARIEAGEVAQ